jgi:hypothetical protein
MTFFTGGIESVSDNGEADAQKFFAKLRPLEDSNCQCNQPQRCQVHPLTTISATPVMVWPA